MAAFASFCAAIALATSGAAEDTQEPPGASRSQGPVATLPAGEVGAPAPFQRSGVIDVGGLYYALTNGYPDWLGTFARGSLRLDARNTIGAEVDWLREFGDRGVLFAATEAFTIDSRWSATGGLSTSAGGFFLPNLRIDLGLHKKWLSATNLVTSLSGTQVDYKDGHRDRALELAAAYYFTEPWVLEAGGRVNFSDPGAVVAPSGFVAATFGKQKEHYLSLRVQAGREAYQLVGGNQALVGFQSQVATFTWRQWLVNAWGLQVRAEFYHNPYYDRSGAELGGFWEF